MQEERICLFHSSHFTISGVKFCSTCHQRKLEHDKNFRFYATLRNLSCIPPSFSAITARSRFEVDSHCSSPSVGFRHSFRRADVKDRLVVTLGVFRPLAHETLMEFRLAKRTRGLWVRKCIC